jgi:hypothetical protein
MRRIVPLLALVLVVALAPPASAVRVNDPDDTRGKFDVSLLAARKRNEHSSMRIRIETYENWSCSRLGRQGNRMHLFFDVDGDGTFDYRGEIMCFVREGPAFMDVFLIGDSAVDPGVRVRHPDGHTLRMTISRDADENPRGASAILLKTRYLTKTGGCSHGCRDRAPDRGTLLVS